MHHHRSSIFRKLFRHLPINIGESAMRILRPFTAAFLVLAVLGCSKKSTKPTEPGDGTHPDIKSFRMVKDTVLTKNPAS